MDKTEIFEQMPIKKAVFNQIIPAIGSQLIVLVYNLTDTYFVGMLNKPEHTAAVTVAYSAYLMLVAISNLFGVGGASAIARALGRKQPKKAKEISGIAFWFGLLTGILYAALFAVFAKPVLYLCGATDATYPLVYSYAKWVIMFGGTANVLSALLATLVRAEGNAMAASFGIALGGILNILLDPLFILPQFLGFGAEGAGMATAISNYASVLFFLLYLYRNRAENVVSLHPAHLKATGDHIGEILAVGLPSALQYTLTVAAVAAQAKFVSQYATEAIAGLGIAKKLDQLPLYVAIGTANGLLPLLAYNHASGNHTRRKQAFRFGCSISIGFSLLCLVVYEISAPWLTSMFIADGTTIQYASRFLRIMVTAMPLMAFCYPMIIQFQAMGRVKEALICSVLRKGVLDIPLLLVLDSLLPLTGCMMVQPIVDSISLVTAGLLYRSAERKSI